MLNDFQWCTYSVPTLFFFNFSFTAHKRLTDIDILLSADTSMFALSISVIEQIKIKIVLEREI